MTAWKEKHMAYLTAAAFAILLARIFFESYLIHNFLQDHNIRETISVFLSHPMTLITMTVITIAFIKSRRNGRLQHNIIKHLILLLICGPAMAGLMMKFIANEGKCIGLTDNFIGMTTVAVIIEIAIYSLVFLINYLFEARRDAMEEKIKANQAKAQYISLKRQSVRISCSTTSTFWTAWLQKRKIRMQEHSSVTSPNCTGIC